MKDVLEGAHLLLDGWRMWRTRPATMALGLVPAVIVGTVGVVALVVLALNVDHVVDWITPFTETWTSPWDRVAELAAGALVLATGVVLLVVTFTGLTLAVGEPFYERIWRSVEEHVVGGVPDADTGFWRGAVDGVFMVLRGLVVAVVAGAIGLIPVVGTVLGWVAGVVLTGWVLAHELTTRALVARDVPRRERNRLLRANRGLAVGFGAATQLCFLVPGGPVATMPAAVAGATFLAHRLVEGPPVAPTTTPRPAPEVAAEPA